MHCTWLNDDEDEDDDNNNNNNNILNRFFLNDFEMAAVAPIISLSVTPVNNGATRTVRKLF